MTKARQMRAFAVGVSLLGTEFPSITATPGQILHATLELFPFSGISLWRPKSKSTAWSSAQSDRTSVLWPAYLPSLNAHTAEVAYQVNMPKGSVVIASGRFGISRRVVCLLV